MEFCLKRGQQCVIRMDGRETEAVKIAVSHLVSDLERTLGVSACSLPCDTAGRPRKEAYLHIPYLV